ncbi:hypothetical protein T484DRAFT_1805898 [Baffinella frigidus]|nr:hypothetical protein T484DRAFT_1805898 [Cryptophyta sp. CCMP2293]
MGAVEISSAFDAGNIEVVDASDATKPITLKVPDDPYTELEKKNHKQWFYFRASGELQGKKTTYSIVNAGQCAYPEAWPGTTVCYSYCRQDWKRCVDTVYDKTSLASASA